MSNPGTDPEIDASTSTSTSTSDSDEISIRSDPDIFWALFDRCIVCGFRFQSGDAILVETRSKPSPIHCRVIYDGSGDVSIRDVLYSLEPDVLDTPGNAIADGYHTRCRQQMSDTNFESLLAPTALLWPPTVSEDRRRLDWLRGRLRTKLDIVLSAAKLPSLPLEVRLQILQHVDGSDMAYCASLLRVTSEKGDFSVRMDRGLWARYIMLAGIRYIASLSDEPIEGSCPLYPTSHGPVNAV